MFGPNGSENFAVKALRSLSMSSKFKKCYRKMNDCCRRDPKVEAKMKKLKTQKTQKTEVNQFDDVEFSSGDSDLEIKERFQGMDEDQKFNRVVELWCLTIAKARGSVQVVNTFGDLNRVIYYHGSTKKLEALEALEQLKPLPFILMPDSRVLSIWNIIMMLLLLYTATYIPFKTAFIEDSSDLVNTIEFSIDSLFFVDLGVNFISAYETTYKNIEFRFGQIAFAYIRSWFLFDLVSCIPFQYLDFSSNESIASPDGSTDGS